MIKSLLIKIIVNLLLVSFIKSLLENLGVDVDGIIAGLNKDDAAAPEEGSSN